MSFRQGVRAVQVHTGAISPFSVCEMVHEKNGDKNHTGK